MIQTIIISWLVSIAQVSFYNFLPFGQYGINFILIVLVSYGIFKKFKTALIFAIFTGLFLDLLSGYPFGFWLLAYVVVFLLLYGLRKYLVKTDYLMAAIIFVISYLLQIFLNITYLKLFSFSVSYDFFTWQTLIGMVVNTILFFIYFRFLKRYLLRHHKIEINYQF